MIHHQKSGFLVFLFAWICICYCRAQQDPLFTLQVFLSSSNTTRSEKLEQVNRVVQGLAFRSLKNLHRCRTGIIYNVSLPSSLTPAITAQAVRLRSGSLRRRGFIFNEFSIPKGAQSSSPHPTRLVLVYRKFDQAFMRDLYPFINDGYHQSKIKNKNKNLNNQSLILAAPVIGIKAYDATNLSTTDASPELKLVMKGEPASVNIPYIFHSGSHHHSNSSSSNSSRGGAIKCAALSEGNNNVSLSNTGNAENRGGTTGTSISICSFNELGDFSLVLPVGEAPPAPAMAPTTRAAQGGNTSNEESSGGVSPSSRSWKVVHATATVVVAMVATVGMVVVAVVKVVMVKKRRLQMWRMEYTAEHSEVLDDLIVMGSRTPTAVASRTRPGFLEQECFETPVISEAR